MIGMNSNVLLKEKFRAMGTDVSIDIVINKNAVNTEREAKKAFEKIRAIFKKNEKTFSRFDENSELSKMNKNLGQETKVSREMLEVLELCLKFYKEAEGYFDPRVIGNLEKIGYDKDFRTNDLNSEENINVWLEKIQGKLEEDLILDRNKKSVLAKGRIDTTGIAKGFTVDEAAKYLKSEGFDNFIVDAGGDMYAEGLSDTLKEWRVGIEGLKNDKIMLKLSHAGIATSGISRKRWQKGRKKVHHLINPKDPENFSYGLKTVTVIKNKAVEADGKAKVLFLMGLQDGMRFANKNNLKALFLDYKGNVYLSEAIKENFINNS